jgi:hypothetical protein
MSCSVKAVFAQKESDFKMIEKARAMYLTGPVPSSISCGVVMDWDGVFQRMKIEETEAVKARIEKLKGVKISVVSRDADHTDVAIDSGDAPRELSEGLRNQLQGFFQIYWSQSYGRLLVVKPTDHFELIPAADGYRFKSLSGSTNVSIEMNKAYLITRTTLESPQLNAVAIPGFLAGEDGLLRLRSLDETINMGLTRMVVKVNLDYQRVGVYDIPQHVSMSLPGSFGFDYTLGGCEIKGDSASPMPKQQANGQ